MSPSHRYESVGDGNIGLETEVVAPAYDAGSGNDEGVGYETSVPIHPKILAPLSYILPPVSGLFVVILERRNTYVRLHAWQSIVLVLATTLGSMLLFWVPFAPSAIHLAGFIAAVLCAFRAWRDADTLTFFKLGIIGDFAERQVLGTTVLPF
ncbi:hypothetical protein LPJ61_003876 [Coemansia biformis]|uniref:Uncharacterized protein n=1 Tax=Coemansia biformis TaxID=1286918 RepID=A0A9W7Y5U4_9FUNG|nr:hypothetical protein LPJ61_003876 [Coemansia biformis]